MAQFTHLHLHTEYSLLDGAIKIKDLIEKAKEFNMDSIAITDHGVMYGAIDFYKQAKKNDIKPIIGCEVYVANKSRFDKDASNGDGDRGHLILLAKNIDGYKNLTKLVSLAFTEGFYYKPRVDLEILEQYHENLIALSGCLAGDVSRAILEENYEKAKNIALNYYRIFGKDHYYLELQSNGLQEQVKVNQALVKISQETGIPLVATNDCHYLTKDDYFNHEVLLCIQTGKKITDDNRMTFSTNEFYLKSQEEMINAFRSIPEAIANTQKIADMCNIEFEFGNLKLPFFKVEGMTNEEFFVQECIKGLKERYPDTYEQNMDRLNYEIDVIKKMGYVDYFLIVADFINYSKNNGVEVGPGRGSAAGSIVAYCLHITDIDPLRFNLLFERFLNPDRISMPDIDIDFCYQNRQKVIEYVIDKYGEDKVAQIITFGTMAARLVIRDVGRALDMPYAQVDNIAKLIPNELGITIDKALQISPDLRTMYENDEEVKKIIDISRALEGMPRHASTHAAGVVITKDPVVDYVAVQKNDGNVTTQFPMTTLEELGLLKMDFLGLRTLTVIRDAIRLVKENYGIDIVFDEKMDDSDVYKMISDGKTDGVFQLESSGMKQFMRELKPENLEDIIAGISLYRPGPMDQIPRYIKNKNNSDHIEYLHPSLEKILNVTYGCMIYQEQVMQIVRELAGYTLGHADLVRRAMAKKKVDVMNKERAIFIEGCLKNNIDEVSSNKIFDEMIDFAKYAFNKSHAAAYAVVAYRTGYLKAKYPAEFMAAMLNSFLGNMAKVSGYINDCKKMGIKIMPPDINKSMVEFSVKNNEIRFGLTAVKSVGEGPAGDIVAEREANGEYKDFNDFCKRIMGTNVNRKVVESLIKAGAFDKMNKRSVLLEVYEKVMDGIYQTRKNTIEGQFNLFESVGGEASNDEFDIVYPNIPEMEQKELLSLEKEMLGLYISGHPLDKYAEILAKKTDFNSLEIINYMDTKVEQGDAFEPTLIDGKEVTVGGIISERKNKITKSGGTMAFVTLEDIYGAMEVIVFPKTYLGFSEKLKEDNFVIIKGRLSIREDEDPKIICQTAEILDLSEEKKLYLKISDEQKDLLSTEIFPLLKTANGKMPVYVFFSDEKITKVVGKELWIRDDERVIHRLKEIIGEDNVKVV